MATAHILAIGTELTQGQITNRNAVWISDRLTRLGIDVVEHTTVPDDHVLIRRALDAAATHRDLIIVTGGLGPTTDDFTRDAIAEWAGRPLVFRPAAWEKIVRRLGARGIEIAPSNRQQCFFPEDATVLENGEGTADGFRFLHARADGTGTELLVLPGPPREGQHLWDRYVDEWLKRAFPASAPTTLETWHCLGKSESSLGELVESAIAEFGVKTGYRASEPYVEVKVWIPVEAGPARRTALIERLDSALAAYSVSRNGEDLWMRFARAIAGRATTGALVFRDHGSKGRLTERILTGLRANEALAFRDRVEIETQPFPGTRTDPFPDTDRAREWVFTLTPNGEAIVDGPFGKRTLALPNPYPNPSLADRLGGYRAEMALQAWTELSSLEADAGA